MNSAAYLLFGAFWTALAVAYSVVAHRNVPCANLRSEKILGSLAFAAMGLFSLAYLVFG